MPAPSEVTTHRTGRRRRGGEWCRRQLRAPLTASGIGRLAGASERGVEDLDRSRLHRRAQAIAPGQQGRPDGLDTGYYVRPTVFADVTNEMTIAREEIFGPVLCILGYDDLDQAVEIANDTDYGLAGYVSGGDLDTARAVALKDVERAVRLGNISLAESRQLLHFYESGLEGYTYME